MAVVGNLTITQLLVLQMKAQATLKEAIRNERSKRWEQVVKNYIDLLKLLSRKRFPDDWKSPGWYSLLMYETHYHLGLAFQRLDRHKRAVHHYTKSIDAISIPKNGCAAKCNSNSCLSTPVFAKRAFGNAKIGELKSSLKDAEKTVVLDSKNPDGFCIRALVHSTRGERKLALGDVDAALLLNPNHACALVIRGTLDKSAMEEASDHAGGKQNYVHPDHLKACLVKPDAQNYLDVGDFKHPRILDFYDRSFAVACDFDVNSFVVCSKPNMAHYIVLFIPNDGSHDSDFCIR
uniref:Uncharacterized protein LOC102802522 n=1 Tax=Saccoglossus kowalevskii TaxID=10224 RepID=A0ABM0MR39_SACKO|nr:PREDICTED: uncharacterized protein LOC102802522 [Saccoglossus kowalevskii]